MNSFEKNCRTLREHTIATFWGTVCRMKIMRGPFSLGKIENEVKMALSIEGGKALLTFFLPFDQLNSLGTL